jgi:hypothetical protein
MNQDQPTTVSDRLIGRRGEFNRLQRCFDGGGSELGERYKLHFFFVCVACGITVDCGANVAVPTC